MKAKSNWKRKSRHIQRTRKQKKVMYGGQSPSPATAVNIFANYSNTEIQTSLNNFLQAAYSVYQAALAIQATSNNQNKFTSDPNDPTRGTRYLQIDSAASFLSATTTIQNSLNNLYMSLGGITTGPTLSPISAPPPLGWTPPPQPYN